MIQSLGEFSDVAVVKSQCTTVDERKKKMNEEYTYDEEASLSADRDMFDKCCISCSAEDAFYDIDLIPEEETDNQ